jgi:hypothetical protein
MHRLIYGRLGLVVIAACVLVAAAGIGELLTAGGGQRSRRPSAAPVRIR